MRGEMTRCLDHSRRSHHASGMVLLLTLVLLVVLSTLVYTVSTRVFAQRQRMNYMISHAKAGYACDSAIKYFEASLTEFAPALIARPNEPDFSDIFAYDEEQYQAFLQEWIEDETAQLSYKQGSSLPDSNTSDPNQIRDGNDMPMADGLGRDLIQVRGPYEPNWPWIQDRIEIVIDDTTKVRIEISDENAKYPLSWMVMDDDKLTGQITSGFEGFMEWMDYGPGEIDELKTQLAEIMAIKPFKMDFKPITKVEKQPAARRTPASSSTSRLRTPSSRTQPVRRVSKRTTISAQQQKAEQDTDFVRLLSSSLLDIDMLARSTLNSDSRDESALKYIGLYGTMRVNVNTAPRHVLEAAFAFCGGDAVDIADLVIQQRRIKPIADFAELKKIAFSYADSIEKCEKFIVTASTVFSVRVKAISGRASASKILVVARSGDKITKLALISG